MRLIPAPRGAGIVAARVPKKVLQMAGIDDCYTASRGSTKTLGNFVKVPRPWLPAPPVCTLEALCVGTLCLLLQCVQLHPNPLGARQSHGSPYSCTESGLSSPHAAVSFVQATFAALQATYDFLTPDLWQETRFEKNPLQEFTDFLAKPVGLLLYADAGSALT